MKIQDRAPILNALAPPKVKAAEPEVEDVVVASRSERELGFGEKLKKAVFEPKRVAGQDTEGSLFQKLAFGTVVAAGAWAAGKVALDIAHSGSVGSALTKLAVDGAALGAGYLLADLPSGLLHHWADNYADPNAKLPAVRTFAKQAQRHHFYPSKLGHYSLSYWAYPLSLVAGAPLAAAAAANAPSAVLAGMVGLVSGMEVYGKFHQWSHSRSSEVPAHGKVLQKLGLAIDTKKHGQHHKQPWNSDYCIVHGHLNPLLNKIDFWPRYERAVYHITGKAPDSWNVPEYKDYVDGKITKEQYIEQSKEMMTNFRATEMERRREKWDIRG